MNKPLKTTLIILAIIIVILIAFVFVINFKLKEVANVENNNVEEENEVYEYLTKNNEILEANTQIQTIQNAKSSNKILSSVDNIILQDEQNNNIVIPVNFKIASDSATKISDGIVIEDANKNQYVWVPVADASLMYSSDAPKTLSGTNIATSYYSKSEILKGIDRLEPGSIDGYREPDFIVAYDLNKLYYNILGYTDISSLATTFANDYKSMIDSIKKYKGFYIGRYELSGTVDNPTEKSNVPSLTNQNWYNLYKACKKISLKNNKYTSTMIWGCQWDITCKWLSACNYDINDSSLWGNYRNSEIKSNSSTEIIKPVNTYTKFNTGSILQTKANNIYDLAGNCIEWTQEAYLNALRSERGGSYIGKGSISGAASRFFDYPMDPSDTISTSQ